LIYRQLDNTYAPAIARNWFSLGNGKTWSFSLEPNVMTHDGQPLTAEDVAFSLELFQGNPRFQYYSGQMPTLESIEATGPYTLTITLSHPIANIEALIHWVPLLPKHIWETIEISGTFEVDKSMLVGTGPFILKEYQPGQQITLVANQAYWMGAPKVDAVVFYTYPNADALADAIMDGHVDLITQVLPAHISDLRSDNHIQVLSGPQTHLRQLLFNVSTETPSTGHPALQDPQVRLAIALAIDKEQLIDVVFLGRAMPGLNIIPPALHTWFNAEIEDTAFDLEEANRILDNAGYADADGDGLREMPDGSTALSLRLYISADSATSSREAEMLANWLRQIGVGVTRQTLLPDTLKAICCPAFDYDMILWEQESGPDPAFVLSTLTTAQIAAGLNETGYSNPAYDTLYEQQATALDQEQRRQIVWQMQETAFNDRPSIILYYDLAIQAFRKDRFQNWLFVPTGILSLTDVRSLLQVEPVQ